MVHLLWINKATCYILFNSKHNIESYVENAYERKHHFLQMLAGLRKCTFDRKKNIVLKSTHEKETQNV